MVTENHLKRDLEEDSYRIATAIFRFAGSLKNGLLAAGFQRHAVTLLDRAVAKDTAGASRAIRGITYLTRFAGEVGAMAQEDASLLLRAAAAHAAELAASVEKPMERLSLAEILPPRIKEENPAIRHQELTNIPSGNPAKKESGNPAIRQNNNDAGENERKEMILVRIRQSGNARLKEIQDALPNLSERTLRYALQRLIEEGKIERVGNGGAGSYYRAVSAPTPGTGKV